MINPKFTAGKIDNFDIVERVKNMSTNKKIMAAGAALGATKAAFDDVDDSLGSTVVKSAVGAGVTLGAAHGVKYIAKKLDDETAMEMVKQTAKESAQISKETEQVKVEAESKKVSTNAESKGSIKVSDVTEQEVQLKHEAEMKRQASEKRIKGWGRKGMVAGAAGLGAFALASVMDTSSNIGDDRRATRMKEEQERNLNRKVTQEKRDQKQYSYGYTDMGDIALELFNNRLGHHKMGNAKFQ